VREKESECFQEFREKLNQNDAQRQQENQDLKSRLAYLEGVL